MSIRRPAFSAALAVTIAAAGFGSASVQAAEAVFINSFATQPSTTRAGGHPDYLVAFSLSTRQSTPSACACNDAKDIEVHLPTGLIGSPQAIPQCSIADFSGDHCPVDSQLGVVEIGLAKTPSGYGSYDPSEELPSVAFLAPVFNLVPPPSQPALLGFKSGFLDTPTFENVGARTDSDYGLDVDVISIFHGIPLVSAKQVTWGVPAAPIHDYLRFGLGQQAFATASLSGLLEPLLCDREGKKSGNDPATVFQACSGDFVGPVGEAAIVEGHTVSRPISSNSPTTPFLQNPTTCGVPSLATSVDVISYAVGESHADSAWPATTDCAQLTFNPSQSIEPTTEAADSPSGAEVRLTVPQFENPDVPSPSELRAAHVTFPAGFSLAPNVTNGKQTCSEAEAKMGSYATTEEGHCPENSKIGTISVDTPVLPGPLFGAVYLGEPKPGSRFRIFLIFDGFGVHVKLPGTVTPDPVTGQIHIDFQDLPQAPFETFNMHVFGSERGPLDTPTQCGTYEVKSVFVPWDSALSEVNSRQFFTVDEGPDGKPCPNGKRPFSPDLQATSTANTGGAHTDFWVDLTRPDGDQNLSSLRVTTPPGFSATLKGVTYCPEASIAAAEAKSALGVNEMLAPSCPTSSYVGELVAGAGPGTHPLYLPGKVYLAGPYKGAPLSFVFITPAVSGGYDLGDVVIRAALQVDPETAQVTAVSDPLPQIFEGIPLRLRQVYVNLNRPNFALNPTDCEPLTVGAKVFGDEGAVSTSTQHFQVANCASLPFGPKLSMRLTGGLNRLGHPAIHAVLKTQPGEANPAAITLTLPTGELLDNSHIKSVCSKADFAKEVCPAGSLLGHASVSTPLLDQPLSGPIYLRASGQGLPDLALDLNGQFHIVAVAKVDSVHGAYRTTFKTVPDVPLGRVSFDLAGGANGLLQNEKSLCGTHKAAAAQMDGQNGSSMTRRIPLKIACGGTGKHKRHHKREGRG